MQLQVLQNFDNLFSQYVNAQFIMFSNNPISDQKRGTVYGYQPFTSYERLSVTTTSTLTAGAFQFDFYLATHEFVTIENGDIKSTYSGA